MKKLIHYKLPNWLKALIFIITISIIGFIINICVDTLIPFWILLGFSLIFSIEKWYSYPTRKHKYLGKVYRLVLNLSILSILGILIWSGIKLFSQDFVQNYLIGSLIFIGEFILFIWLWRVVSKNSWRWPSMKLTVFSLVCLFILFAFTGVKPMSSIKDEVFNRWDTYWAEQKIKSEEKAAQEEREKALAEEEAQRQAQLERINSEQNIINEENTDANGDSLIDKTIDAVDDLWDTSIEDYAVKFNQYRQSESLTPLEFTDDLNQLAELRLKELYTDFSHHSKGNYNEHLAENIAMSTGFLSNSDALVMWQNSPLHNANMLDRGYKYTGYAIGNGYAVQLFTEYTTINGKPQLPHGWYWLD